LLLRNRESGGNRGNRGGVDAEKKRTEKRTLGNTRGNMLGAEELFPTVTV